jgi:RimJ/RimL family protein N-acetyltransferase
VLLAKPVEAGSPDGHDTDMNAVELSAGGLRLRPFRPSDAPDVLAACQDPELQRWVPVPVAYVCSDAEEYVSHTCPEGWARGDDATFAIVDSTSGRLLCSIGLHGVDRADGIAVVGYWCAPHARGRGVMTRPVGAVCRRGIDARGRQRIEWHAEVGNVASRRVAEKAGFTIEGVLRSRLVHRGVRVDVWSGSLLAHEVRR